MDIGAGMAFLPFSSLSRMVFAQRAQAHPLRADIWSVVRAGQVLPLNNSKRSKLSCSEYRRSRVVRIRLLRLPWRDWIVLGLYLAYLLIPGIAAAGQVLVLGGFALVVTGTDLF